MEFVFIDLIIVFIVIMFIIFFNRCDLFTTGTSTRYSRTPRIPFLNSFARSSVQLKLSDLIDCNNNAGAQADQQPSFYASTK